MFPVSWQDDNVETVGQRDARRQEEKLRRKKKEWEDLSLEEAQDRLATQKSRRSSGKSRRSSSGKPEAGDEAGVRDAGEAVAIESSPLAESQRAEGSSTPRSSTSITSRHSGTRSSARNFVGSIFGKKRRAATASASTSRNATPDKLLMSNTSNMSNTSASSHDRRKFSSEPTPTRSSSGQRSPDIPPVPPIPASPPMPISSNKKKQLAQPAFETAPTQSVARKLWTTMPRPSTSSHQRQPAQSAMGTTPSDLSSIHPCFRDNVAAETRPSEDDDASVYSDNDDVPDNVTDPSDADPNLEPFQVSDTSDVAAASTTSTAPLVGANIASIADLPPHLALEPSDNSGLTNEPSKEQEDDQIGEPTAPPTSTEPVVGPNIITSVATPARHPAFDPSSDNSSLTDDSEELEALIRDPIEVTPRQWRPPVYPNMLRGRDLPASPPPNFPLPPLPAYAGTRVTDASAWRPPREWAAMPVPDGFNLPIEPEWVPTLLRPEGAKAQEMLPRRLLGASQEVILSHLSATISAYTPDLGKYKLLMRHRMWAVYASMHWVQCYAIFTTATITIAGPRDELMESYGCPSNPRHFYPKICAVFETHDSVAFIGRMHPSIPTVHLDTNPVRLADADLSNIEPVQVRDVSGMSAAEYLRAHLDTFTDITCFGWAAKMEACYIPALIQAAKRALAPGGALHLIAINPLPIERTLGPKLRAWLHEHLVPRLRQHGRLLAPVDVLLGKDSSAGDGELLTRAGLSATGSTRSLAYGLAYHDGRGPAPMAPMVADADRHIVSPAAERVATFVVHALWTEHYAEFLPRHLPLFWDVPELRDECRRHATMFQWLRETGFKHRPERMGA